MKIAQNNGVYDTRTLEWNVMRQYTFGVVFAIGERRQIRRVPPVCVVTRVGAAILKPDNQQEGMYPVAHE
jgi:hypothetical protein